MQSSHECAGRRERRTWLTRRVASVILGMQWGESTMARKEMMPQEPWLDGGARLARCGRDSMAAWAWRAMTGTLFVVSCSTSTGTHPDASFGNELDGDKDELVAPGGGSNANDGAIRLLPSAHGVFVPVTFASNWTSTATQALAVPDVDGIAVDLAWTDIAATANRTYDFTKLDPLLQLARAAGKGVELSVIGAGGTPSTWFDPQSLIHLQYSPHNGATDRCYDTIAPPPWDAVYLAAWDDMTAQLAGHISSAGYSDTVVALRLTGLNASTPETHLPAQSPAKLTNPPVCLTVDSVAVWQAAGYTPVKIQAAWSAMVASWATHFPDLPFELVLWPGANDRFPPIDDNGTVVPPKAATDQARYDAMVAEAARQLGSRLMVGTWFLMTGSAADAVTVGYANQYGIGTLWQTNLWWRSYENLTHGTVAGAAACGGTLQSPAPCTDQAFLDELDQGVHPAGLTVPAPAGATRVIEVFVPDPTLYPNATHAVHQALTP